MFFEIIKGCVLPELLLGGNANNGANAGFSIANSDNSPAIANANLSSQLCFFWRATQTMPLGKKTRVNMGCW